MLTFSIVRDSLDGWALSMLGLVVLWIWQNRIRRKGPPVLSIDPDEEHLNKQKVYIQKAEQLRRYMIGFATASVVLGIATIVAWLYQNLQ